MTRPNREPDFIYTKSYTYFWFDKDMIEFEVESNQIHEMQEKEGVIFRINHWNGGKYIKEIQEAYKVYINKKIEQILLGSETESK